MRFKKVYICKPGCYFEPKEGKTNLQIRELEAFKVALEHAGVKSELVTIPWLLEHALDINECSVICFNSAKCFDKELTKLFQMLNILDEVDITLVSNDCRLNFNVGKPLNDIVDRAISEPTYNIRILTNASNFDESYLRLVAECEFSSVIAIEFAGLFALPAFMPGARCDSKTIDSVYACMHFKDYSEKRQNELIALKQVLKDRLVLTGDMSGMIVDGEEIPSIVTDTSKVWQWYKNTKTTPVLLEPQYERYGVMPNRVAEAIACRCVPILYCEDIEHYMHMPSLPMPAVQHSQSKLIETINAYSEQYYSDAVQNQLAYLEVGLAMYRTQFVIQLHEIYNGEMIAC